MIEMKHFIQILVIKSYSMMLILKHVLVESLVLLVKVDVVKQHS